MSLYKNVIMAKNYYQATLLDNAEERRPKMHGSEA
jgi:hypothetical protein